MVLPKLVVAPPAGTTLLFCGNVMHAGVPVTAGERNVMVCSLSMADTGMRKELDVWLKQSGCSSVAEWLSKPV